MSTRFATWEKAHAEAQKRADSSGLDVAIRKQFELGKDGYNVSYASWNDNDYAVAEIVTPKGKQPTDRNTGKRGKGLSGAGLNLKSGNFWKGAAAGALAVLIFKGVRS